MDKDKTAKKWHELLMHYKKYSRDALVNELIELKIQMEDLCDAAATVKKVML